MGHNVRNFLLNGFVRDSNCKCGQEYNEKCPEQTGSVYVSVYNLALRLCTWTKSHLVCICTCGQDSNATEGLIMFSVKHNHSPPPPL